MLKYLLVVLLIGYYYHECKAKPQDIETAALMAAAQVKEAFDNGAAAKDKKEFEFMGFKAKNDMEIGFGDAMRTKRSIDADSSSSSSSSSSESEESYRSKRSPNSTYPDDIKRFQRSLNTDDFQLSIQNSEETKKPKRSIEFKKDLFGSSMISMDLHEMN